MHPTQTKFENPAFEGVSSAYTNAPLYASPSGPPPNHQVPTFENPPPNVKYDAPKNPGPAEVRAGRAGSIPRGVKYDAPSGPAPGESLRPPPTQQMKTSDGTASGRQTISRVLSFYRQHYFRITRLVGYHI
eukprot:1984072-Pyramimonas_sp.AAC.3